MARNGRLQHEDLTKIFAQAMVGLRLFCAEERFPELMLALTDYCDHEP